MNSFDQLVAIWGNIKADEKHVSPLNVSRYQKKLLEYFHVGPFYYYVFNVVNTSFEYVSENALKIIGIDPKSLTVPILFERIHPEDLQLVIQCENAIVEFCDKLQSKQIIDYKFSYDYRVRKSNGMYTRILQQVITLDIDPESGKIAKTLGIHTDISHIKPVELGNNHSVISFTGMNQEPSYVKSVEEILRIRKDDFISLSDRQKQIVSCLMSGMSSKEIADRLFISKHTVDTHRRKILQLLGVSNTQQLIIKLNHSGWL